VESPQDFLARWHYAGLFGVILAEEAGIPLPLPGDLFIAAMGFLAHSHRAEFLPVAGIVTLATVLGASALYLFSRHAGRPLLVRVGRRFGYTEAREARLEGWLSRRGWSAVVIGRLIPGLRIVMTVVAGALRLPHRTFVVGTAIAGALWATIYFWLGYLLGAGFERLGGNVPPELLWPAGLAAGVGLAALILLRRARKRRLAAAGEPGESAAGPPRPDAAV
jgi:membrane protein DedA with SNARE-associated domain